MTAPSYDTVLEFLAFAGLALATLPATLLLANLPFYRRLPSTPTRSPRPRVSVLIPARNEENAIVPALRSVLADPHPNLEVLVLDDHSTDNTRTQVEQVIASDPRVRLVQGKGLPEGWCGKQHACWQLAQAAQGEVLVFMDADVRLAPDALPRIAHHLQAHPDIHLTSGVPGQITRGWLEQLLIPLIHVVLLGYLPMVAARLTRWSAFAAGCGQLFIARRDAYFAADGHRSIRASLHDGVQLPRAFRRRSFQTGLFDATDVAECRMYQSAREVWRGLGKNATEGMAHPAAILPWTVLLLGGHVLPWLLLAYAIFLPLDPETTRVAGIAAGLGLVSRLVAAVRFRQSLLSAFLHPFGIAALVALQWEALGRRWRGRPMEWRGRRYAHPVSVPANSHPTA